MTGKQKDTPVTRYMEAKQANVSKLGNYENYEPQWIDMRKMSPENTEWFWPNFIPSCSSSLFAGNGGIGKSLVLLSLISSVSNGKPFMCCGTSVQLTSGSAILMSAEGRLETDVVPKLIAAGANFENIDAITSNVGTLSKKRRLLQLDRELSIIEDKVKLRQATDAPVRLIVIDPITYFTGEVRDHVQQDVANFIHQLNDLAETYKLTIIFNKHRRKQSGGQTFASLADEVGGTAAWVNSPRQAVGFIKHPKAPSIFLMGSIKSNATKESGYSYPYTIEGVAIGHNGKTYNTIKLVWGDKMERINLNDASSKDLYEKTKQQQCSDLIFDHLKTNGVTCRADIIELCNKGGINERLRQRVISAMKKAGEINEVAGMTHPQFELGSGFDSFGK